MLFLSELDDFGVAEADALGLARLAMKAHGFTEAELEKFSRDSQKLGTPRKRKKQYFSNLYDVVESYLALYRKHKNLPEAKSYLAQYRKHKNIPEFNPAHYRQKINYLRKNPSSIIPD